MKPDAITCPKCGRPALVIDHTAGEFFAVHKYEWKFTVSQATGKPIRCNVPTQVCKGKQP